MLKKAIRNLFIKLAVFSLVIGMFSPLAGSIDQASAADYGVIRVRTNLSAGSYTIYKLQGNVPQSDGSGLGPNVHTLPASVGLGIGYKIVFDEVDDYVTPPNYYFNLTTGADFSVGPTFPSPYHAGEYIPENQTVPYETATIKTNIAYGSYVVYRLSDGVPMGMGPAVAGQGIAGTIFNLPAGQTSLGIGYKVVFGNVEDYIKPADKYFNLVDGVPFSFTGIYTPENQTTPYETATINTNIAYGSYTIYKLENNAVMGSGPAIAGQGVAGTVFNLPAGETSLGIGYKVVFGNVENYIKPADKYFNLVDGVPFSWTGIYTPDNQTTPFETVTINTNIAFGSYTIYKIEDDSIMGSGPAVPGQGIAGTVFNLPAGATSLGIGYRIEFGDVTNYTTPPIKYFNLVDGAPFAWTGIYNQNPSDGYITVEVVDENDEPITDGIWDVKRCTGEGEPENCTTLVVNGGTGVTNMPYPVYAPTYFRVSAYDAPAYGEPMIVSENPQILTTGGSVHFKIMYAEQGVELAISATTDGTPAEVDFLYCTGTNTANSCTGVQTTSLTDPIYIEVANSGDQFLAFEELGGYFPPENQVSSPPEAAQDVNIAGHPGYYYYPLSSDELTEGALVMNYATDNSGTISVTVEGPAELTEAEVIVEKEGVGTIGTQTIINGETGVFSDNVTIDTNYLVTCEEIDGFQLVGTNPIQVHSADFDPVTHDAAVTCEYAEADDFAYLNITTNPVPASVTLDVLSSTPADQVTPQTSVTTELTALPLTYELSRATPDNRFSLLGDGVSPNVNAELQVTCNPAPGGVMAPAPFTISATDYPVDAETYLDPCIYTLVEDDEKVTIQIDTINVTDSAIYVDMVEVRSEGDDDVATVEISVMEEHVISFADRTGFVTPYDIVIPADTYSGDETGMLYLGYYIEYNDTTPYNVDVEVTTRNTGGTIYLEVADDPTHWIVGHVENPGDILLVQVDRRVNHEFHFEDKNYYDPPYVLRAEPEVLGACTVAHEAGDPVTELSGSDTIVTHYQQHYVCPADVDNMLPAGVSLTGHYIQSYTSTDDGNAAFFRAHTTNTDVSGEIYVTLGPDNDSYTYDEGPMPGNWTPIFVSDVENDTDDETVFESPVTYMSETYAAVPGDYQLTSFAPSNVLNDLEATYYQDVADVTIQLVSLDGTLPNQPEAGMDVYMDQGTGGERIEQTIDNAGDIEALFDNVNTSAYHEFTCPAITGFHTPGPIVVPAGVLTPGSDNLFHCLYVPDNSTDAQIQIQTTAEDQANNFDALIVLTVNGDDYNLGYTYADAAELSHMELWVDTSDTNTIQYEDIPPYVTPADAPVNVLPGTSYTTNPGTNIFTGLYTLAEEATINVYTIDEVITDPAVSVDGAHIDVVRLADSMTVYSTDEGKITDLTVQSGVDYRIDFGPHPTDAEYTAPASIFFNLTAGDEAHYLGAYVKNACEVEMYRRSTLNNSYLNAEVLLRIDGGTQFSVGTGNPDANYLVTYMIDQTKDAGTYEFTFPALPDPLDIVNPSSLDLPTTSMTCPYIHTTWYGPNQNANVYITLLEQNDPAGDDAVVGVNVNRNSVEDETSDAAGQVGFLNVNTTIGQTFTFGPHPTDPSNFTTPLPLAIAADTLVPGQDYYFTVYYVYGDYAILDIETLSEDNPLLNVDGEIYLVINSGAPVLIGIGTAQTIVSLDPAYSYEIDWGPAGVAGYIEPATDPQAVDLTGVTNGETVEIDGLYRTSSSNTATVALAAYEGTVYPDDAIPPYLAAGISVNGIPVGAGMHIGTYTVGQVLNIAFEDLSTHQDPTLYIAGGTSTVNGHTTTLTVSSTSANNLVQALYPAEDGVGFTVAAEDHQGNELNVGFDYGTDSGTTPLSFNVLVEDLDNYTITFDDIDGYVTPEDVVITDAAIDTIPAGVSITLNGVDYTAGTEFDTGDAVEILGTYEPKILVTKEVVQQQLVLNNNKRVDYHVTITRNPRDTSTDNMTITIHDTLADGSPGVLTGNNGGVLAVVPYNSANTTCYYPSDMTTPLPTCPDITIASQDVTVTQAGNAGSELIIFYQLLSNNTGIPAGQISTFSNTITASYDDGSTVEYDVQAQVDVNGPPSPPGPGPGPSGGGGGGGIMEIYGDMKLEIEKLVSLDGKNYFDASDPESAFAMPKNTNAKLYVKVKVTNLGKVSATDIEFSQAFDGGKSGMTADGFENLKGATINNDGEIEIQKIIVGGTQEFTYTTYVRNTGQNGELAKEFLVLEDFGSALSKSQDQLTYIGIGDEYPSYLYAGDARAYGDERIRITVQSDKSEARIGDIVNFLITVENLTDGDVTGLMLAHDYDESALEVVNPFGGRDNGREVQWTRALLRAGEKASFQVQARVGNGAPVGQNVRGVTRALVDQFEGIAPVENFLYIIGGVQLAQTGLQLAQTGPATIIMLLILAAISYLCYREFELLRYLNLKKAALR